MNVIFKKNELVFRSESKVAKQNLDFGPSEAAHTPQITDLDLRSSGRAGGTLMETNQIAQLPS